jgi:hypothetical protein
MSRSRASIAERVVASSMGAVGTPGARASAAWLLGRNVVPPSPQRWHVQVLLAVGDEEPSPDFDDSVASRFHIDIYSEEWGVYFCHAGRASWIRVTDVAFVHGRDDFQLIGAMPALEDVGALLRSVEHEHAIRFQRARAAIKTNLASIETKIRNWVSLL